MNAKLVVEPLFFALVRPTIPALDVFYQFVERVVFFTFNWLKHSFLLKVNGLLRYSSLSFFGFNPAFRRKRRKMPSTQYSKSSTLSGLSLSGHRSTATPSSKIFFSSACSAPDGGGASAGLKNGLDGG